MIVLDKLLQGSPEWHEARCGVKTASFFSNIITPTGKPVNAKKRSDYMLDLAHERISKKAIFIPSTFAMQRGNELEPDARNNFEFIKNIVVNEVGMVYTNDKKDTSCSPDGLIGKNSGLEIKCPLHKVHLQTLIDDEMPSEHIPQVQGSMFVTGRKSWWFMSYHPDHKPFIKLIERDEEFIKTLNKCLWDFEKELKEMIVLLTTNKLEKVA